MPQLYYMLWSHVAKFGKSYNQDTYAIFRLNTNKHFCLCTLLSPSFTNTKSFLQIMHLLISTAQNFWTVSWLSTLQGLGLSVDNIPCVLSSSLDFIVSSSILFKFKLCDNIVSICIFSLLFVVVSNFNFNCKIIFESLSVTLSSLSLMEIFKMFFCKTLITFFAFFSRYLFSVIPENSETIWWMTLHAVWQHSQQGVINDDKF